MSVRARVYAYLIGLHVAFGAGVVWASGARTLWILGVEAATVVSLVVGLALARRVLGTIDVGESGIRFIEDGDFTARLRPTGEARLDRLVAAYNTMVDSLRAERARVLEQEHLLSKVMAEAPSGFLMFDFDGRVSDLNPAAARLIGRSREALLGTAPRDLPAPLGTTLADLAPGATEGTSLPDGRRIRCHHGTFLDRGFPRSFFLFEELTDETRRAERSAYEKLIRVMSHEVSNSVTAAGSLLESSLVYARELQPESRAELEQALRIAIDRIVALNQFMAGFAAVYRLPAPVRRRVELRALLSSLVALFAAWPDAPAVTTSWASSAAPVWVSVDRDQFEQVIVNVLKNAVQAAGPDGHVGVGIDVQAGATVITIDDTGPGLEPEAAAHLFTPFFSTRPQGQGIGLTLAREILGAHGHDYALERLPEGVTRFRIVLPDGGEAERG